MPDLSPTIINSPMNPMVMHPQQSNLWIISIRECVRLSYGSPTFGSASSASTFADGIDDFIIAGSLNGVVVPVRRSTMKITSSMVKSFIELRIGSVQRVTSAESEDRAVYLYLNLQSSISASFSLSDDCHTG
jgi:hypothetical protein